MLLIGVHIEKTYLIKNKEKEKKKEGNEELKCFERNWFDKVKMK